MKIKCIYDEWVKMPGFYHSTKENKKLDNFNIIVNEDYVVYGITLKNDDIWYYICDEAFTYFPRWKPSPLFEVIDQRLSRYWIYSFKKLENFPRAHPIITYSEWANNHPEYYDKLSDGEEREVAIFKEYKTLMDLEFPDSSISEIAQIGDEEWLICPSCMDAWNSPDDKDGMVICPKCKKIMHNPRYKNTWPRPC